MKTKARIALVTGGNRGIGLEVCCQPAQRGCKVLLGTHDRAKGQSAVRTISGDVEVIVVDVADPDAAQRVANEVKARHGRLDVLVNKAGVFYCRGNERSALNDVISIGVEGAVRKVDPDINEFRGLLRCIHNRLASSEA
jgi:NAD(P)-dependent dehydrogenase (short-subunit alcohol dehydrogenase family)